MLQMQLLVVKYLALDGDFIKSEVLQNSVQVETVLKCVHCCQDY